MTKQLALILLAITILLGTSLVLTPPPTSGQTIPQPTYALFLPIIRLDGEATPDRYWDPRLNQRGAVFIPALVTPGEPYWRLTRAVWYNSVESEGRRNIFVDTLDESGQRQVDVPVLITWPSGDATIITQPKPGEIYAADFPMQSIAPAYMARPVSGPPADAVDGMGLGEIDDPLHAHHTSYGLVWQWTIAATATPSPAATPTATVTATPTVTVTLTLTPTVTVTATATPTPTVTAPTLVFPHAEVIGCAPSENGSRVEGTVFANGQPADGVRVVFSYEPDGPWVPETPALTGPNPPGFYTHILGVGVARAGDWSIWLVAEDGGRISALANFTTDGPGGVCNIVTVNFYDTNLQDLRKP